MNCEPLLNETSTVRLHATRATNRTAKNLIGRTPDTVHLQHSSAQLINICCAVQHDRWGPGNSVAPVTDILAAVQQQKPKADSGGRDWLAGVGTNTVGRTWTAADREDDGEGFGPGHHNNTTPSQPSGECRGRRNKQQHGAGKQCQRRGTESACGWVVGDVHHMVAIHHTEAQQGARTLATTPHSTPLPLLRRPWYR